jgi:hypothetical protein
MPLAAKNKKPPASKPFYLKKTFWLVETLKIFYN